MPSSWISYRTKLIANSMYILFYHLNHFLKFLTLHFWQIYHLWQTGHKGIPSSVFTHICFIIIYSLLCTFCRECHLSLIPKWIKNMNFSKLNITATHTGLISHRIHNVIYNCNTQSSFLGYLASIECILLTDYIHTNLISFVKTN